MKKSNAPQTDYKEFEPKPAKTHGILKWVLLTFLLIGGGLVALMFLPVSEYVALNREEADLENVVRTMRQDIESLQELVRKQAAEKEQQSPAMSPPPMIQENITPPPVVPAMDQEALRQVKTDLKQKVFWSILLTKLTRQLLEGVPYEATLNQLETALPPGQVSLEALRVFAASGMPDQRAVVDQAVDRGQVLQADSRGVWGRFMDFLGRLVSIRRSSDETEREAAKQAMENTNPFEMPTVLKARFPNNESMIRVAEQRADALKNLDTLESFIINTLQES